MASGWRCLRRCRLQAPSSISKRNRSIVYALIFLPLLLVFLLIPGGEIASYKYTGDTSKAQFISTFISHTDGSDDLIRKTRSLNNRSKVILLWTDFFGSRTWGVNADTFDRCPVSNCEVIVDRSRISEADAVLFNARGFRELSELPQEHLPWQVWILHGSEPPYYIYIDLHRLNNVFNWTSWYRTDADIFAPYGGYIEKNGGDYSDDITTTTISDTGTGDSRVEGRAAVMEQATNGTGQMSADTDVYRLHDRVMFIATSNCRDPGRRYKKVAQLKQFLPIDEFGDCGTYQCPKNNIQCNTIMAKYQFVLAFENGYCRDYMTEKLWNAYRRMQIPIVSGGADYEKFAIPGSYIDYDNFSSVEELANFIHSVSTSPDLYNSYFAWHKHYQVVDMPVTDWCELCEKLNDNTMPPQVYKDLAGWVAQDSCPVFNEYQYFWTQVYLGIFKTLGL